MNRVLNVEAPDLAILNGDLISGDDTCLSNSTDYLDIIVKPLVSYNIPWASTYGNHDNDYNLSSKALLKREQRYKTLAYTRSMVNSATAGVTNYYLPIYSSNTRSSTPLLLLWFFDSQGGTKFQKLDAHGNKIHIPGVVDRSVVEWFR